MSEIDLQIGKAIDILTNSNALVALTGAGISTPSGIPDFRSPSSGMWDRYNPMEVATIYAFQTKPASFYDWVRPLIKQVAYAEPNPAHHALAALERHGPLTAVITQNFDLLHTKAGSEQVYEVHGHMRDLECLSCGVVSPATDQMNELADQGTLPTCIACGSIAKPAVVLFGEMLPGEVIQAAERAANLCDVMIVVGSSLEVSPVNQLPLLAKRNGAKLIMVNFAQTELDVFADVIIRGDVAEVLPKLAEPFLPKEGATR